MNPIAGQSPVLGTTVAGYRIEALIGRGGMGAVYRADEEILGREVALKVIAPGLADDSRFRERFLAESRTAASLDHPNVIPIYHAGTENGLLYLAMRYVGGTDLARLLAEQGALEPGRAVDLLAQVAEALDAAHEQRLVHRDVKPSNVLIGRAAGKEHCYLADFGLTERTVSLSDDPVTGDVVGTLDYVAPEQITGGPVGPAADVYSLGCVLHECLTGQTPFPRATDVALLWAHVHEEPERPSVVRAGLPVELDEVVARALAKEPEQRFPSAGELVSAARSAIHPLERDGWFERARRRLLAGGALLLVALALVAALLLFQGSDGLSSVSPNAVGVISPSSNRLVGEVPVGTAPGPIAVGAGGVWVANGGDQTVSEIDFSADDVVRTFPLDEFPSDLAVAHRSVWVAQGALATLIRFTPEYGDLATVDAFSKATFSYLRASDGATRVHCDRQRARVAADTEGLWHFCSRQTPLTHIDPHGASPPVPLEIDYPFLTYPGAVEPEFSDFLADFGWLWFANIAENTIWVVDASTGKVVDRLLVGDAPRALAVGLDSLWVANSQDGTVLRIEVLNPRQVFRAATIRVGEGPSDIAVGEGGVWVLNGGDATVSRIDPETNEVTATIRVGNLPRGIAVGGGSVWVSVAERTSVDGR